MKVSYDEIGRLRAKIPAFARKIAPLYKVLGWTWCGRYGSSSYRVPGVKDIERTLRSLLRNSRKERGCANSTGGLTVCFDFDGYGSLEFTYGNWRV